MVLRKFVVSGLCFGAFALGSQALAAQSSTPIQHVIVIFQENRSFDSYFGTFPGADGIPNGTCIPLDVSRPKMGCVVPFHDVHDTSIGGPHAASDAQIDLDNGITTTLQDGFVQRQQAVITNGCAGTAPLYYCNDVAAIARHDVAGYHTDAEIPNYWAYAENFVLQDRMFEGVRDWSQASHLDLVSEWSATCSDYTDTSTCMSSEVYPIPATPQIPWVGLFQLLDANNVSWKYYIATGGEPDCDDGELTCYPVQQNAKIMSIWNPVAGFAWVRSQSAAYLAAHNPSVDQFFADIKAGTLPQVAWLIPDIAHSEHPGNSGVTSGMVYVTALVNAVMQSPYWNSTAIFVTWDDWGGFYDHVVPPLVDRNTTKNSAQGFGIRVPGLMISAYAKAGVIDHQLLDFDSYATLIENLFANGERLVPASFGNPDNRPDIRDADERHLPERQHGTGRRPAERVRLHPGAAAADGAVHTHSDRTDRELPHQGRRSRRDVPGAQSQTLLGHVHRRGSCGPADRPHHPRRRGPAGLHNHQNELCRHPRLRHASLQGVHSGCERRGEPAIGCHRG